MTDFSTVYEKSKNSLITILSDGGDGYATSSGFVTTNDQGKKFIITTAHSVLTTPELWGMDGILYKNNSILSLNYYKTINLAIPANTDKIVFRTSNTKGSVYIDTVVLKQENKIVYRDNFKGNSFSERWSNGDGQGWTIQKYAGRIFANAAKSGNKQSISTLLLSVNSPEALNLSVTFKPDITQGSFVIGYCTSNCHNRVSRNISGYYNNEIHKLKVIGLDGKGDISILLPADGSNLDNIPALKLAQDSRSIPIGSAISVMGNPLGLDIDSIATGVVRDNRYTLPNSSTVESILTSAPVFSGNSGSPYILSNGQVAGMLTWGIAQNMDESALNAGPTSTLILKVLNNLTSQNYENSYNDYNKGYTGLKLNSIDMSLVEILKLPMKGSNAKFKPCGFIITDLDEDSPLVNILQPLDIITNMKSKDINITLGSFQGQSSISEMTWYTNPKDLITITFLRFNMVTMDWELYEANNVELIKFPSTKDVPLANTMDLKGKQVFAGFKIAKKLENRKLVLNKYVANENI